MLKAICDYFLRQYRRRSFLKEGLHSDAYDYYGELIFVCVGSFNPEPYKYELFVLKGEKIGYLPYGYVVSTIHRQKAKVYFKDARLMQPAYYTGENNTMPDRILRDFVEHVYTQYYPRNVSYETFMDNVVTYANNAALSYLKRPQS